MESENVGETSWARQTLRWETLSSSLRAGDGSLDLFPPLPTDFSQRKLYDPQQIM
jgi:hypothetical protein